MGLRLGPLEEPPGSEPHADEPGLLDEPGLPITMLPASFQLPRGVPRVGGLR